MLTYIDIDNENTTSCPSSIIHQSWSPADSHGLGQAAVSFGPAHTHTRYNISEDTTIFTPQRPLTPDSLGEQQSTINNSPASDSGVRDQPGPGPGPDATMRNAQRSSQQLSPHNRYNA
eukprot:scaffold4548_cov107-Isochrysis_galbana.AAC.9